MTATPERGGRELPELALRFLSGVVLIAVALAATWQGGMVFVVLCAVAAALILAEYLRITASALPAAMAAACAVVLALSVITWFALGPKPAFTVAAAGFVLLAGWELVSTRTLWAAAGLAYAALPFLALSLLRANVTIGAHFIVLLFTCVWATDSFAYFVGRSVGGPKLAPAISPNKTVSGFFGGLAGAICIGALVLYFMGYGPSLRAVVLMAGLSIVAQVGDLFESWIKRRFGVKDSGAIIPGHGGVLDRIDGLVMAGVAAWLVGGLFGGQILVPGVASKALFTAFVLP